MVSHHPTKFRGLRNCGSEDMFLVVKGQDSACSHLDLPLLFTSKSNSMTAQSMSYQLVQSWSQTSRVTNDETLTKNLLPVPY